MGEVNSRRSFLQKCFSSVLSLAMIPVVVESCHSKSNVPEKKNNTASSTDPCGDYSGLSEEDIKKRQSLGFVQKASSAERQCGNCNLWLPPADNQACGICQLFKGPVPSTASCTYWAPKV